MGFVCLSVPFSKLPTFTSSKKYKFILIQSFKWISYYVQGHYKIYYLKGLMV